MNPGLMAAMLLALGAATLFAQPDARTQVARAAAVDFTRGDYAALYQRGAPVLHNAVTQATFEQQVGWAAASLGVCRAPSSPPVVTGPNYVFRIECERRTIGIAVSLDGAGLVQGFFVVPPPEQPGLAVTAAPPNLTVVTGDFKLPARLTLPTGTARGPSACVVLVHGSGPNDMDETVMGVNKPFRDLAEGLATRGIATLRYDKRTKVYGILSAVKTMADETVDDAVSAAHLCAAQQPAIDPKRVFVLGHSLGGYALPRIGKAAGQAAARGLIVMAGTSRPLGEVIDEQIAYLGAPPAQGESIKKMIPDSWWKDVEGYDPPKVAVSLDVPFLILQGERDYQVTMADFARWRAAFGGGPGSKRATFRSYPKLNHLFMAGEGKPGPGEYAKSGRVAEAVLDDIAAWVTLVSAAAASPK